MISWPIAQYRAHNIYAEALQQGLVAVIQLKGLIENKL